MRKRWAAAVAMTAALGITGCSSGSGDGPASGSAGTASPATTAAVAKKSGPPKVSTLEEFRSAVQDAGVSCPDASWEPNLAPKEDASAEGLCAGTLTLLFYSADQADGSELFHATVASDLADVALDNALNDGATDQVKVAGSNWAAIGAAPTIAMIRAGLGGKVVK